jgi:hypothetical protein
VMVCFVLPGVLHVAALRRAELPSKVGVGDVGAGGGGRSHTRAWAAARALVPRGWDEAMGGGMALVGVLSGATALWATIVQNS